MVKWPYFVAFLCIFELLISQGSSEGKNTQPCAPGTFYNQTHCVPCKECPLGQGAKKICDSSDNGAGHCYDCTSGLDFSNQSSSTQPCHMCTDCHKQFMLFSVKCRRDFDSICQKCPDGTYFVSFGDRANCSKCSGPCRIGEVEEKPCTYQSDRQCKQETTQVTPTVATRIEDKANASRADSIPDYLLVIIIILAIMIVVFPFYWVYKYCTRKTPADLDAEDAKPRLKEENGVEPHQPITKDTHLIELPYYVQYKIGVELRYLATVKTGMDLNTLAHEAGLSTDFIQLRLKNESREPADEFLNEYQKRASATIGNFIDIIKEAEDRYDGGNKSHLREYLTLIQEDEEALDIEDGKPQFSREQETPV